VDLNDKAGSMQEFGDGYFLTLPLMDWMIRQYIPDKEARRDVYASPIHAGNFQNLPAAFVITAECDPLRDQGETYARKLEQAGVPVRLKRYEGVFHPFFQLGGVLDAANEALRDAGSALRQVLGSASAAG
jgi:acetyl esterase